LVKVVASRDFHDRFVILNNMEVNTYDASLKDLWNKYLEVSKIEDTAEFLVRLNRVVSCASRQTA